MTRTLDSRREWVGVLSAALLGLVLTVYVIAGIELSKRAFTVDFIQFFASARSLAAGDSPYTPLRLADFNPAEAESLAAAAAPHPNLNPPVLSLLLAPVGFLGLRASYLWWTGYSLISGLLACALVWRGLHGAGQNALGLVWLWLVFLIYFPTYKALTMGQVTMVTLLPLVGAWFAARSGNERLAGTLLGVAVSLKVFIALVAVFFAIQRRWRIVAWAIGTVLFVVVVTLPFVSVGAYVEYFSVVGSVTWFGNSWNASYAAAVTRVLGGSENVPLVNLPKVARGLVLVCSGATLLWLAWLTWPRPGGGCDTRRFDLGYGLTLTVMLLVSPLGWMYYFPFLLLPGYAIWSLTRSGRLRVIRWGLVGAWGLSTIPTSMVRATDVNDPLGWFTSNSVYFYALCLLAIVASRAVASIDQRSDILSATPS